MLIFIFSVSLIVFSLVASLFLLPTLNITSVDELNTLFNNGDPGVIRTMKMVQLVSSIGSFIVPAHIFSLLSAGNYKEYFGFDKKPAFNTFLLVCLVMLCAMPLINAMAALNAQMQLPSFLSDFENWLKTAEERNKIVTQQFLKMDSFGDLWLNLFIVAFIPALGEEMFFRGAMQKTIIDWNKGNIHKGIWISAIVFSAFHFQFYGFLPRMVIGAMLGYMMVWGGSVWLPVAAHFTNNAAAVILSYLIQKEHLPKSIEEVGSVSEEIIYTVLSIVIVGYLLFRLYKSKKSNPLV
jgi:membrane protease YdiL (CAAX protease family)